MAINLSRFDLVSIRVYIAAVEAGSLTAGAQRFGISLAAASKRVGELEQSLGSALLTRSKRGIATTAAGQTLYRHAVKLVADLEQLAVAMGDYGQGVQGHVRLWANTSAVNGFLATRLASYLAAHPRIRIDLEEAPSDAVVRAVANGLADLGVFGENTAAPGLQTVVCDTDELVLIVPRRHALARLRRARFAQALDCDFIGLERSTSLLRLISGAADAEGKALRMRVQLRSFDAICRMIAHGIGIGILPRQAAQPHVASMQLRMVALAEPWAQRRLLLGVRDRATLSPWAAALTDAIAASSMPQP